MASLIENKEELSLQLDALQNSLSAESSQNLSLKARVNHLEGIANALPLLASEFSLCNVTSAYLPALLAKLQCNSSKLPYDIDSITSRILSDFNGIKEHLKFLSSAIVSKDGLIQELLLKSSEFANLVQCYQHKAKVFREGTMELHKKYQETRRVLQRIANLEDPKDQEELKQLLNSAGPLTGDSSQGSVLKPAMRPLSMSDLRSENTNLRNSLKQRDAEHSREIADLEKLIEELTDYSESYKDHLELNRTPIKTPCDSPINKDTASQQKPPRLRLRGASYSVASIHRTDNDCLRALKEEKEAITSLLVNSESKCKKALEELATARSSLTQVNVVAKELKNKEVLWTQIHGYLRKLLDELPASELSQQLREKLILLDNSEQRTPSKVKHTKDSFINHLVRNPALLQYHMEQLYEENATNNEILETLRENFKDKENRVEKLASDNRRMREMQFKAKDGARRSLKIKKTDEAVVNQENTQKNTQKNDQEAFAEQQRMHLCFLSIKELIQIVVEGNETVLSIKERYSDDSDVKRISTCLDIIVNALEKILNDASIEQQIAANLLRKNNPIDHPVKDHRILQLYKEKMGKILNDLILKREALPSCIERARGISRKLDRIGEWEGNNEELKLLEESIKLLEKDLQINRLAKSWTFGLQKTTFSEYFKGFAKDDSYNSGLLLNVIKHLYQQGRITDQLLTHQHTDHPTTISSTHIELLYSRCKEKDLEIAALTQNSLTSIEIASLQGEIPQEKTDENILKKEIESLYDQLAEQDNEIAILRSKQEESLVTKTKLEISVLFHKEEIFKCNSQIRKQLNKISTLRTFISLEQIAEIEELEPDQKTKTAQPTTNIDIEALLRITDNLSTIFNIGEPPANTVNSSVKILSLISEEARVLATLVEEIANILCIGELPMGVHSALSRIKLNLALPQMTTETQTLESEILQVHPTGDSNIQRKIGSLIAEYSSTAPPVLISALLGIYNTLSSSLQRDHSSFSNPRSPLSAIEQGPDLFIFSPKMDSSFERVENDTPASVKLSYNLNDSLQQKLAALAKEHQELKIKGDDINHKITNLFGFEHSSTKKFLEGIELDSESGVIFTEKPRLFSILLLKFRLQRLTISKNFYKWKRERNSIKNFPEEQIIPPPLNRQLNTTELEEQGKRLVLGEMKRTIEKRLESLDLEKLVSKANKPMGFLSVFRTLENLVNYKYKKDSTSLQQHKTPQQYYESLHEYFTHSSPEPLRTMGNLLLGLKDLIEQDHPYAHFFGNLLHIYTLHPISFPLSIFLTKFHLKFNELISIANKVKGRISDLPEHSQTDINLKEFEAAGTGGCALLCDSLDLLYSVFSTDIESLKYIIVRLCPESVPLKDYLSFLLCHRLWQLSKSPVGLIAKPKVVASDIESLCEQMSCHVPSSLIYSVFGEGGLEQCEFSMWLDVSSYLKCCISPTYSVTKCKMLKILVDCSNTIQITDAGKLLCSLAAPTVSPKEFLSFIVNTLSCAIDEQSLLRLYRERLSTQKVLTREDVCAIIIGNGIGGYGLRNFTVKALYTLQNKEPRTKCTYHKLREDLKRRPPPLKRKYKR